jgi:hypothetical protein
VCCTRFAFRPINFLTGGSTKRAKKAQRRKVSEHYSKGQNGPFTPETPTTPPFSGFFDPRACRDRAEKGYFFLNPAGHTGLDPVTFLLVFPLMQVIVLAGNFEAFTGC